LVKTEKFSNEFKDNFLKNRENCLDCNHIPNKHEIKKSLTYEDKKISIKQEIDSPLKSSKKSSISNVSSFPTTEDSSPNSNSPIKKTFKAMFFQKIEAITSSKKDKVSISPIKLGNQKLNVEICKKISLKKDNNIAKNLSQFKIQLSKNVENHKNRPSLDQIKEKFNLNIDNFSINKYKLNNSSNINNNNHINSNYKSTSLGSVILPLIITNNHFNPIKEEKDNFSYKKSSYEKSFL